MDDLPVTPPAGPPPAEPPVPATPPPLDYEEAPVPPQPEETPAPDQPAFAPEIPAEPTPPPHAAPTRKQSSCLGLLGTLLLFALLFGIGVWLSTLIRQFVPAGPSPAERTPSQTAQPAAPTARPTPADPFALWQPYQVVSSITRQPVPGVSYKLPPEVLSPLCDGSSCISQGTYLPGGTRFTVAARGSGQALRDYRGAIVSDALGQPFTTKTTLVAGRQAVAFGGTFTGTTIGGYSFSRMAGVMIPVTDTVSVEINHFTPSGVTADFDADEALFQKILGTFTITGSPGEEKGSVIPMLSPTPASSVSSTPAPLR